MNSLSKKRRRPKTGQPGKPRRYEDHELFEYRSQAFVKHKLLTEHEEIELAARLIGIDFKELRKAPRPYTLSQQNAIDARDALVTHNIRLVIEIALRYRIEGSTKEDVMQSGILGLVQAAETYDPFTFGTRFSTHAFWWIRQQIMRDMSRGGMIKVPQNVWELLNKCLNAEFRKGLTEQQLELYELGLRAKAYEDDVDMHGRSILRHAPSRANDWDELEARDDALKTQADVNWLLGWLKPKQRRVIELRFGLNGSEPLTLDEVGRRLGITRERVRQITISAMKHMKVAACV